MAAKFKMEKQDRNGVRVRVTRWVSGGTTVTATCQCFGHPGRIHSNEHCPLRQRQVAED